MNQQAAKNDAAKSGPHASTYFPLSHSARGGLDAVIKPIRLYSGYPDGSAPAGVAPDSPAGDASDDASDNNPDRSARRTDRGSHLRAGACLPRWVARLFHVS